MENCHLQWVFPYIMVIFHTYVSLPEVRSWEVNPLRMGNKHGGTIDTTWYNQQQVIQACADVLQCCNQVSFFGDMDWIGMVYDDTWFSPVNWLLVLMYAPFADKPMHVIKCTLKYLPGWHRHNVTTIDAENPTISMQVIHNCYIISHIYGKSPCPMGISTISIWPFSIAMLVITRG